MVFNLFSISHVTVVHTTRTCHHRERSEVNVPFRRVDYLVNCEKVLLQSDYYFSMDMIVKSYPKLLKKSKIYCYVVFTKKAKFWAKEIYFLVFLMKFLNQELFCNRQAKHHRSHCTNKRIQHNKHTILLSILCNFYLSISKFKALFLTDTTCFLSLISGLQNRVVTKRYLYLVKTI